MPSQARSDLSPAGYTCAKCKKSFSKPVALADHSRTTGHLLSCTISGCLRVFTTQQALEQHLRDFVHKTSRSNQVCDSSPQRKIPSAQKGPKKSGPNASTSSNIAPTNNDVPGKLESSRMCHKTFQARVPPTADSSTIDSYKRPLERNGVSATYSLSQHHKVPDSVTGYIQIPQPASSNPAQHTNESVQDTSLYGWYTGSDINNCYLIATPRNGGPSVVSPIVVDCGSLDYDFAFLLPKLQQTAQSTSTLLSQPGCCKTCGVAFSSWKTLMMHFKSSKCSILPTQLLNEEPVMPVLSPSEGPKPRNPAKMSISTSKSQSIADSKVPVSRAPTYEIQWSIIPEPQRIATLTALTMSCHSFQILTQNKYTSGPGYSKILGVEVGLSLMPLPTPVHDPQVPKRGAVALDCEMVGVNKNGSEVARISAIDCLSGEVLIDTLVQPTQPVTDWRTKFSGITKKAMTAAVVSKRALKGWPAARAELWEHIDSNTILIGQALYHDLDALRMQHWRIVDSAILAKDAVGPGVSRQWGLKNLCKQLLGIDIQSNGKKGHDSVEDAFAAREVVLWCIGHQEELAKWAKAQRAEYFRKKKELEEKRAKRRLQQELLLSQEQSSDGSSDENSEDEEIVRWEDIAEGLGWPHPDTGYDPWSD
ncbi:Nn.00g062640.m01.CDS01 [Neocucurbitaria sp. VM-36]